MLDAMLTVDPEPLLRTSYKLILRPPLRSHSHKYCLPSLLLFRTPFTTHYAARCVCPRRAFCSLLHLNLCLSAHIPRSSQISRSLAKSNIPLATSFVGHPGQWTRRPTNPPREVWRCRPRCAKHTVFLLRERRPRYLRPQSQRYQDRLD